jgi:hypothetical protein
MKTLLNSCAAVALLVALASQAHAQIQVHDAPVHAVPADEDAAPVRIAETTPPAMTMAAPAPAETSAEPARQEPSLVKALTEKTEPAPPALTAEEDAFFAILGHRVTDAASAYETYVRRATAIDSRFGDAAAVQKAVKAGAAYQPQQLQEGIVAYAALLALRNEAFVAGVKGVRDPTFADRLTASPQMVLGVRGADDAASDVAGALRAQGSALMAAGKTITQAAYDVQAQGWSKNPVTDPQGVLAGAKESATQPRVASVPAKERLLASLVAAPQTPVNDSPAVSGAPDVVRGLALAALAIMGRTGDDKEATFEALLHDATSADCLKMAKLNLNQCLAVAGPHYEDLYCTGRHAVSETATCVSAAANGAGPGLTPSALPPQRADGYGPEQAQAYGQPGLQPRDREDDDTPTRYAAAQPAYAAPQAYAPPAPAYAQNDRAYAAPYQDPRAYAPAPQPQYQQQPYAQPRYPQQAYAPPQPQAYQGQPTVQYPYGYAARGYYGQ